MINLHLESTPHPWKQGTGWTGAGETQDWDQVGASHVRKDDESMTWGREDEDGEGADLRVLKGETDSTCG